MRPSTNKRLFWSLPSSFTGNQIKSYGGKLEFVQRYTERSGARHSMDIDVMLSGNGVTVYWSNPERLLPDQPNVSKSITFIDRLKFCLNLVSEYICSYFCNRKQLATL